MPPRTATGSIKSTAHAPSCKHTKNGGLHTARRTEVSIRNNTYNGQIEQIVMPIPNDYNCNPATLGGCWFSIEFDLPGTLTDTTTWTANIGGDPVRLVE